ncbi:hypothetical protein [Ochrobactrum sp. EDr1-4]
MTAKLLALSALLLCIAVAWFFYRLNKSGAHPHGAPKPYWADDEPC